MSMFQTDQSNQPKEGATQNTEPQGNGAPEPAAASVQTPAAPQGRELHQYEKQLLGDLRGLDVLKDIPTLNDLVVRYKESSEKLSRALVIPDESAKPEDWDTVYTKLGRPDKPEGYKVDGPNANADAKLTEKVRAYAHETGLDQRQFTRLLTKLNKEHTERQAATKQSQAEQEAKAKAENEKAWGALKSEWGDKYQENESIADQAIKAAYGDKYDEIAKHAKDKGYTNDPIFLDIVYRLGAPTVSRGNIRGDGTPGAKPRELPRDSNGRPRIPVKGDDYFN